MLFLEGVSKIIEGIKTVISNWNLDETKKKRWIEHIDHFFQVRFEIYAGINQDYNKTLRLLFTNSIIDLSVIQEKLNDSTLPLSLRQLTLRDLLDGDELERCGTGTSDFIHDARMQLETNPK